MTPPTERTLFGACYCWAYTTFLSLSVHTLDFYVNKKNEVPGLHFDFSAGVSMFLMAFLISFTGFRFIIRNCSRFFGSLSLKKNITSSRIALIAVVVSFYVTFLSLPLTVVWIWVAIMMLFSPLLEKWLRTYRKSQIKFQTLVVFDQLILILKSGHSLKNAIEIVESRDRSWFTSFLHELKRALELQVPAQTESVWFNSLSIEIVEIHRSRVKVVDQFETLRRILREEVQFQKKMNQVLAGPRFQTVLMGILFIILNIFFFIRFYSSAMIKFVLVAWTLFILGLAISRWIVGVQKWKV